MTDPKTVTVQERLFVGLFNGECRKCRTYALLNPTAHCVRCTQLNGGRNA